MTRSDAMASGRPRTVGVASTGRASSSSWRALVPAALLLALALVLPSAALAASEPTSGYTQTAPAPTTTPTTGTLPSKEEKPAATTPEPTTTSTTATTPTESTLPFTGFDLRWDIGFGVLLVAAGFSIVAVQRRQRRQSGR